MKTIYVLNGPNLNLLGTREPEIYGIHTLVDVETLCHTEAQKLGYTVLCHHSNHEGELIDYIHQARGKAVGLIINAGAFTHTSIAIHDALRALEVPIIEVHLSNLYKREAFRHSSFVAPVAIGTITGFGILGYKMAITALDEKLRDQHIVN